MTKRITVTGLVQGIGYRPFVAELAEELNLSGEVKNAGGIVTILADGEDGALEIFIQRLRSSAPQGAVVADVQSESVQIPVPPGFRIAESEDEKEEQRILPPDLPVCGHCVREMADPANRRYRYPFISCVSCGPRFSIMRRVPYDRETITMDAFPMCADCGREYRTKGDRRRHAQTIACKDCGPHLRAVTPENEHTGGKDEARDEDAWKLAITILREGGIVAVKDIGGFHLAFLPDCSQAAQRLREFKEREKKPFAVMFPGVDEIRQYCRVSEAEERLLLSSARPIVLLEKEKDFAPEVCAGSDRMGAFLPCNPLQILLLQELGPLVMTSGNRGGEPIITEDFDMLALMRSGCPDLILTHDREILTPLEDSVCQVTKAGVSILRRGRGHVPEPIRMSRSLRGDSFAAGGDLKAVFAHGKGSMAYLSSPFGDLDDERCLRARRDSAAHMAELLNIHPKRRAVDLHPGYHSGNEKLFKDLPAVRIQHHHAHILSVMAEHGLEGPVLGAAFDGTGYGRDGQIWGGEFMLCRGSRMERVGHFAPVTMVGGDAAAKDAALSLWCYLLEARDCGYLTAEEIAKAGNLPAFSGKSAMCGTAAAARRENIQTCVCTSLGRLFDAVSALLGICDYNSYEGECAICLEQSALWAKICAGADGKESERAECAGNVLSAPDVSQQDGIRVIDSVRLVAELFAAKGRGGDPAGLALAFHRWIVAAVLEMFTQLRADFQVSDIALSGGCFCNRILLDETVEALADHGFSVYRNESVPCGDGGLALGQLYFITFETEM